MAGEFKTYIIRYFLIVTFLSAPIFADETSELTKNIVDAAIDAILDRGARMVNPNEMAAFIEQCAQTGSNALLKGVGDSFKEGNGFDDFTKNFGQAAHRSMGAVARDLRGGMEDASSEISKGMGTAVDNFGKEIHIAFAEGNKFDLGIQQFFNTNAKNMNVFIDRVGHRNMLIAGATYLTIIAGYYGLKYSIPLAIKMIERRLMRPKLIIESSKTNILQKFSSLFKQRSKPSEMVFSSQLKKQLDDTVKKTTAIHNKIKKGMTNLKYRNLMLYGPPGTGKTMFAKELAKQSGLEYVFMSGSSFSKFKDGEAIEALDELFAWAKKSKGLLIFIDEAEAFLSKREGSDPQSKAYQLLNNFLNYTGERSAQFMIVFATNHKETLDSAMYRRIDDLIEMPLPSKQQRAQTLSMYKEKILMDVKQNGKPFVDSVCCHLNEGMIDAMAEQTKWLAYADLEGIIYAIKTDADITDDGVVTPTIIETVLQRTMQKYYAFTNGKPLGLVEN